jgi:8-oxo-dGTP diphosphatase
MDLAARLKPCPFRACHRLDDTPVAEGARQSTRLYGESRADAAMQREYPACPLVGVGAVVVDEGRVLLVRRGTEPLRGHWSIPGGLIEVGEALTEALKREVREETGLEVEVVELIELLDRIHREEGRVRFHYVIADYLCTVTGGELRAATDADAVRWVERAEWNSHSALKLEPITVRVIEAGCQRARALSLGQPDARTSEER